MSSNSVKNGGRTLDVRVGSEVAHDPEYDEATDAFKDRMKTIFQKAILRGVLYRNGQYVDKT